MLGVSPICTFHTAMLSLLLCVAHRKMCEHMTRFLVQQWRGGGTDENRTCPEFLPGQISFEDFGTACVWWMCACTIHSPGAQTRKTMRAAAAGMNAAEFAGEIDKLYIVHMPWATRTYFRHTAKSAVDSMQHSQLAKPAAKHYKSPGSIFI